MRVATYMSVDMHAYYMDVYLYIMYMDITGFCKDRDSVYDSLPTMAKLHNKKAF